jgi:hypothetical protein
MNACMRLHFDRLASLSRARSRALSRSRSLSLSITLSLFLRLHVCLLASPLLSPHCLLLLLSRVLNCLLPHLSPLSCLMCDADGVHASAYACSRSVTPPPPCFLQHQQASAYACWRSFTPPPPVHLPTSCNANMHACGLLLTSPEDGLSLLLSPTFCNTSMHARGPSLLLLCTSCNGSRHTQKLTRLLLSLSFLLLRPSSLLQSRQPRKPGGMCSTSAQEDVLLSRNSARLCARVPQVFASAVTNLPTFLHTHTHARARTHTHTQAKRQMYTHKQNVQVALCIGLL